MHLCWPYTVYTNPTKKRDSTTSSKDNPKSLCTQQVSSLTPRRPDLLTAFCSQTKNTMGTTTERSSYSSLTATQSFKADRASGLAKFSFDSTPLLLKPEAYNGKHSNIFFQEKLLQQLKCPLDCETQKHSHYMARVHLIYGPGGLFGVF